MGSGEAERDPGWEVVEVLAGVVHFSAVREETLMEVKITGPYEIEYVLEADDPRGGKSSIIPGPGRPHPFSGRP